MFFGLDSSEEKIFESILEDLIERNKDVQHFIRLLDAIGGGTSIAIDGSWGSGKTFFVKQCKMVLDAMNPVCDFPQIQSENDSEKTETTKDYSRRMIKTRMNKIADVGMAESSFSFYYDAWDNDNEDDPLISLIYSIATDASEEYKLVSEPNIRKCAASIIESISGINPDKMIDYLKGENPFDNIKNSKDLRNKIHELIDSLTEERGNRVVIFIDELDRCNPVFAIKTLERVKHYLNHENVTFVFSVNLSQLEQTIKTYYGKEFDAGRYLDRFFDLRLSLPPANTDNYYSKVGIKSNSFTYEQSCMNIVRFFDMGLREVAKFYQTAKIAAYNPTHSNRTYFGGSEEAYIVELMVFVPYLIALGRVDNKEFETFINGKGYGRFLECIESSEFLCNYLTHKLGEKDKNGNYIDGQIKDIIDELYEALFVYPYDKLYTKEFRGIEISKTDKERVLRIVSGFYQNQCFE